MMGAGAALAQEANACQITVGAKALVVNFNHPPKSEGLLCTNGTKDCVRIPAGETVHVEARKAAEGDVVWVMLTPTEEPASFGCLAVAESRKQSIFSMLMSSLPTIIGVVFGLAGGTAFSIISVSYSNKRERQQKLTGWVEDYRAILNGYLLDKTIDIEPPRAPAIDFSGYKTLRKLRRKISYEMQAIETEPNFQQRKALAEKITAILDEWEGG